LAPTNENVSFNPGILAEARKYKTLISSLGWRGNESKKTKLDNFSDFIKLLQNKGFQILERACTLCDNVQPTTIVYRYCAVGVKFNYLIAWMLTLFLQKLADHRKLHTFVRII
jgi:hypothetical protein